MPKPQPCAIPADTHHASTAQRGVRVVDKLCERGLLIGLEILVVSEFPLESLPTLFNLVVMAYLADVAGVMSIVVSPGSTAPNQG
jgi:hypothetical protein